MCVRKLALSSVSTFHIRFQYEIRGQIQELADALIDVSSEFSLGVCSS